MAVKINWVEPSNSSVGSVLIYKATDNKLDSLGSRTLVATISARDGTGSWVVSYTDSSGIDDNIYRVQFWDGVGSSILSDAIGQDYSEQLATFDDVLRLSRLNRGYDIGSDIVFDAIRNATEKIYSMYGDPVKKTYFYLDSNVGVAGAAYNFTGDLGPVYQVREVFVDNDDLDIVPNSSYTVNFGQGTMKFDTGFIGSYNGKYVYVHWIPSSINILVKNEAALELLEGELLLSGRNTSNPQVERIKNNIGSIQEIIRPKGVFAPRLYSDLDSGYDYVEQRLERKYLYFN